MLYLEILRNLLSDSRAGYYLASSGRVAWNDIYRAMAKGLSKRNAIETDRVDLVDDATLEKMGHALGCPKEMVSLFLGGNCSLEAVHGRVIGWSPQHSADHILQMADAEVDVILQNIRI